MKKRFPVFMGIVFPTSDNSSFLSNFISNFLFLETALFDSLIRLNILSVLKYCNNVCTVNHFSFIG